MSEKFEPSKPIEEIPLKQLLGEAVGAASTAWHPDGEFDSEYALGIVDTLEDYIDANYLPRHLTGEAGLEGQGVTA